MEEVLVTRRGQTTIPIKFRRKYDITEGARLEVLDTNEGLLLRKKLSTIDLIGKGKISQEEAFRLLDRMREEDER